MARYIDADRLRNRVKTETNPYGKPTLEYASGLKVLVMIDKEPSADVVEVVRCKDCIMSRECEDEEILFCMLFRDTVDEQAYCSYGIPPERDDAE